MMTPRERINGALEHRETDRTPADLGSTCNTSITYQAYRRLTGYLGVSDEDVPLLSRDMQVVEIGREVHRRLHIDTIGIHGNPPDNSMAEETGPDSYRDEWGIEYRAAAQQGIVLYYEVAHSPLAAADSVRDIESYPWPDPGDPGRTRGLERGTRYIRESTDYALIGHMGDTSIFQDCTLIRGLEQILTDLLLNKTFAEALMVKVTEIQMEKMSRYLDATGPYLDVVCVGDDFGGQTAPLMSPEIFRKAIKPFLRQYYDLIKSKTAAKLHLHSCGSVRELIGDFIDLGVDVLNPVQVSARGMDPAELKRDFGRYISFWGGIDTHRLLPRGSPAEVSDEVRRIVEILGRSGGYVLNPVHNIQPDVPPENIVAMYDAILA
jgi:uroporphyrinogen decarboxylase